MVYFGIHTKELPLVVTPVQLFSALEQRYETAFLLESSSGVQQNARYSFVGFSPAKEITLKQGILKINGEVVNSKNPISELQKQIKKVKTNEPGFIGGAVGYFSFEYANYLEIFEQKLVDTLNFPDFEFGVYQDGFIFDHVENKITYFYQQENRLEETLNYLRDFGSAIQEAELTKLSCNLSKEQFCKNIKKAKEYIKAGDAFQIVLSKRYDFSFSGNLISFYKKLKAANPSPYMYYLKFGKRQVIGTSPENLVKLNGNEITSYATLAGTRQRGKTKTEDASLEQELLNDEKERAEHIMLVDLTRNDLGKVAEIGSVEVPSLMKVQKYSHVQHIASLVKAKLKQGKNGFDVFNAIFPAGTVSGAPKIRAIEIIRKIEKTTRGPYGGAVGYFSSNGSMDFAICIRTLIANSDKAYIQTGAGIVYGSVPEKEFEETENKAKALLETAALSGEE